MTLLSLLALGVASVALTGCSQPPTTSGAAEMPMAASTESMESDTNSQGCSACTTGEEPAPAVGTVEMVDGAQVVTVGIVDGYYTPNQFTAKADAPIKVVFKVEGKPAKACVSKPTFKSLDKTVAVTSGEKSLDLGMLAAGTYEFSCAMGANKGTITVE
jgi:hypothetical protein